MLKGEVAGLQAMDGCAKFLEAGYIGIGQKSPGVWRHPKHQLGATSDRLFIDGSQLLQALQRRLSWGYQNQCSLRNGVSASMGRQRR